MAHGTGTRVHPLHSGWRSGPAWDEAYAWQERACLDAPAIALYRALGFEQEGIKRRAMRFDGVDFAAPLMAQLRPPS